jgi:hypothetical protein
MITNIVVAAQNQGSESGKAVAISKDRRIAERVVVVHSTQRSTRDQDNPAPDAQPAGLRSGICTGRRVPRTRQPRIKPDSRPA